MSSIPIYPPVDGACPRCVIAGQDDIFCDVCGLRLRPGAESAQERADNVSRQWEMTHPEWQRQWEQELGVPDADAKAVPERAAGLTVPRSSTSVAAEPGVATAQPVMPPAFHCRTCAQEAQWLPNGELWCQRCRMGLAINDTVEHTSTAQTHSVREPVTSPTKSVSSGFALWSSEGFVGLGTLGLVVLAILFFAHTGPFASGGALSGDECVVVTLGGNKLCGDDAKAWCDSTDSLRELDAAGSAESQAVCDSIRR